MHFYFLNHPAGAFVPHSSRKFTRGRFRTHQQIPEATTAKLQEPQQLSDENNTIPFTSAPPLIKPSLR